MVEGRHFKMVLLSDLRSETEAQRKKRLHSLNLALWNQNRNASFDRKLKKTIAMVKTVIREKELVKDE